MNEHLPMDKTGEKPPNYMYNSHMPDAYTSLTDPNLIRQLMDGAIGVLPTDTIYGIVTKALNVHSVDKLYEVRRRPPEKPSIVLISSLKDLDIFFVEIPEIHKSFLENVWPGKVSIIMDSPHPDMAYLHKGTDTIAFRIPDYPELLQLIDQVGPIIAPSANLEGQPPAKNIDAAREYFGDSIDFYVDIGDIAGEASTVVKLEGENIKVLRQGATPVETTVPR